MKLTRLDLSGFKSFADHAELPFDDGITAIVGPNGCGKSNVSDAVRWVLGEQRARILRSARMDEVIFQGSVKRRPISIAEVTLVFDNSDGTLSAPYRELAVTRRLSRSGQSEYLLNQSPVRLRDLLDLLRGTGLGSDAGVVIEAAMIDRLLSDRADERRALFEEAAGIGIYRDRKASTERRLEKTAEDLQRVDDLIAEVQTQVRSLARQRGKAERHGTFTAERFAVVMTLTRRELDAFEERHAGLRARRDALRATIPAKRERLADLERARETHAQGRATAVARRTEVDRRLSDTRIELERLEGDLNLAAERLEQATRRRGRAQDEHTQADERAARAQRELEAARAEREAAERARASVQGELDLRTASEDEARQQLAAKRERVRGLEGTLQQHAETQRALAGERAALERELEELTGQERELSARCDETAREQEAADDRLRTAQAALAEREREEQEAARGLDRARDLLASARERETTLRAERRELEESLAQDRVRREALHELERRREGLAPAARALLAARERFPPDTITGPLSDFLATTSAEAHLAERRLADWLHAVLVRDDAAVAVVRRWHAETRPGPLVLLPVAPGPAEAPTDTAVPPGIVVTGPARPWVAALFGANRALDDQGAAVRRANGAVYLAGDGETGPLRRRAELDELGGRITGTESQLARLAEEEAAAAAILAEAEAALETATERRAAARAGWRESQAAADEAARLVHRATRERGEADQARARLQERVSERRTRLRQVTVESTGGEAERTRLEEQLTAERAALADLEAAQEAARERRVHWQVEEAQVSAREDAAREREERARRMLEEARTDMASLDRESTDIDQLLQSLTGQRATWTDTMGERRVTAQELEHAAQEAERAVAAAEEALTAGEQTVHEARDEVERLSDELHAVELEATEAEGRRRALIERVEGEWHRPVDELLRDAPPLDGTTEALRAEAARLAQALEALGPVNPLAVEEHAEEVKRLDFLTTQRDDLAEARSSLQQALREINQTARALFVETFAAVREHFRSVFHTLFEGGDCDVRLAEESDPLASDIEIIAAPRGKRAQRIHLLSSGERALVAISLLFSIYLAKPAPFCLLDEVDAPLDDANVMRFVRLLNEFKSSTQFIVITHNPRTMQVADAVYGVTMQEPGVSTIVGVRLGEVEPAAV